MVTEKLKNSKLRDRVRKVIKEKKGKLCIILNNCYANDLKINSERKNLLRVRNSKTNC